MDSIVWLVTYKCKSGMAEEFVRAIKDAGLQAAVRAEDGCMQYDYYISCEAEDTVLLVEHWRDQAAVKRHAETPTMEKIKALKAQYVEDTQITRCE
ncbi:MAG: antibiotic biosynthesis monooxygenase [Oscillospiraceae bacterium]|nr:antibiotic biosynthesis monooxygenase [Oscillospiraceae bacterium]